MKRLILLIAAVGFSTAAQAQDAPIDRLRSALALEWFVANCQQADTVSGVLLMQSGMLINGATFVDVSDTRKAVQDQILVKWGDADSACAGMAASLAV